MWFFSIYLEVWSSNLENAAFLLLLKYYSTLLNIIHIKHDITIHVLKHNILFGIRHESLHYLKKQYYSSHVAWNPSCTRYGTYWASFKLVMGGFEYAMHTWGPVGRVEHHTNKKCAIQLSVRVRHAHVKWHVEHHINNKCVV